MKKDPLSNFVQEISNSFSNINYPEDQQWSKSFSFPDTPDFDVKNLLNCTRSALFAAALNGGLAVHEGTCNVTGKKQDSVSSYEKEISSVKQKIHRLMTNQLDCHLVYVENKWCCKNIFYSLKNGAVMFILDGSDFYCTVVSTAEGQIEMIGDLLLEAVDEQMAPL